MNFLDKTIDTIAAPMTGAQVPVAEELGLQPTMDAWKGGTFFAPGPAPAPISGVEAEKPDGTFVAGDEHADKGALVHGVNPHQTSDWLSLARTQLKVPYVWADSNPVGAEGGPGAGFDCSGFAQWVVKRITGVTLTHHAATMATETQPVGKNGLRSGDLLFFAYGGGIQHVEIYMGNGRSIGAQGDPGGLDEKPVDWTHFVQGGRVPGMSSGGVVQAQKGAMMRAKPMPDTEPAEITTPNVTGPSYFAQALHGIL